MRRLLSAGFSRLFKNKTFYLGMIVMTAFAIFGVVSRYIDSLRSPGYFDNANDLIFSGYVMAVIAAAVFTSLFVGTDYSDGTVRGYIIVGHTRLSVYLSNLIVCSVSGIIMSLCWPLAVFALGSVLFEAAFSVSLARALLLIACGSLFVTAADAICLLISMNIRSKAAGAVLDILLCITLLLAAVMVSARLDEPEYYPTYSLGIDGDIVEGEERNPRYLTDAKRRAYETAYILIPAGGLYEIAQQKTDKLCAMSLAALVEAILATSAGAYAFGRKNL